LNAYPVKPGCQAGGVSAPLERNPLIGASSCTPVVDFVPFLFFIAGMWTRADELRLSVVMGLRRGLGLIRGMRRTLTEEQQHTVARAIVDHLESTNWKIEQGPPREGHGQHLMPK
jgi:hypothetical protein